MSNIQEMKDNANEMAMGDSYRLFLDMSSTCTGYVVAKFSGRKCTISRLGVMWFDSNVPNGQKYHQMHQAVGEFYTINAITDIIYESYHVNPKQVGNSLVVPEMIGAMKAACHDVWGMPIGYESIPPTGWRGALGIKALKSPKLNAKGVQETTKAGKPKYNNDWKTPVINYMDTMFDNNIPKTIISNITGKTRSTPNDLYDALGVCCGWHRKMGISEFEIAENAFDGHPNGSHGVM